MQASKLAADEGLEALAAALGDPDPSARILALDVICEFSVERAARLLSGALYDPDQAVRSAAATAAGRLRASGTVFSLIVALDDSSPEVRAVIATAIGDITGREVSLDGMTEPRARKKKTDELKAWWTEERYRRLVAEVEES
jgi:HEAT repeat protein